MGYTTEFEGSIAVEPPLSAEEISYLTKFNDTRRMRRKNGPYCVEGSGFSYGVDSDVIDHNNPPEGQPGLWCQWRPTEDGKDIIWDGGEKFYDSPEWMQYIIDHFIGVDPIAKKVDPENFAFLQGHVCNGQIEAQGEYSDDRWLLIVENNKVKVAKSKRTEYGKPKEL